MNFFSFGKSKSKQKDEKHPNMINVYLKQNFNSVFKIQPKQGMTVQQLIDYIITELKLNDKISYQLILVTHRQKDPENNIIMRRKLQFLDQPFRLLIEQKHSILCQSLLIDYAYNTIQNNYVTQVLISDTLCNALQKFEQEFLLIKTRANGEIKQVRMKINSQGILLAEREKFDKFYQFQNIQIEFVQQQSFLLQIFGKTTLFQVESKSEFYQLFKMIQKYSLKTQQEYYLNQMNEQLNHINQQKIDQITSDTEQSLINYDHLSKLNNFQLFTTILKQSYFINHDLIEKLDDPVIFECNKDAICKTMAIYPNEIYRDKLIKFNKAYELTASFKIDDEIFNGQNILKIEKIQKVLASQEEIEKYSHILV